MSNIEFEAAFGPRCSDPKDSKIYNHLDRAKLSELRAPEIRKASSVGKKICDALRHVPQKKLPYDAFRTTGTLRDIHMHSSDVLAGLDAVICELEKAKNEICIQAYILELSSDIGAKLLKALKKKQREIPEFKIFIACNRFPCSISHIKNLLSRQKIKAYLSTHPVRLERRSLHSKSYIIDGSVAFIGGANVNNPNQVDYLAAVQGSVVDALLCEFDNAFLAGRVVSIDNGELKQAPQVAFELPCSHARNLIGSQNKEKETIPMMILSREGRGWLSSENLEGNASYALLKAIDAAQSCIRIVTTNLNEASVWDKLAAAAKRGVRVSVMIPYRHMTFLSFLDRCTNSSFPAFCDRLPLAVQKNIKIRWFSHDNTSYGKSHSKYLSIDGEWAYIGSQNMDNQSFKYSRELGIGIEGSSQVALLDQEIFESYWKNSIKAHTPFIARLLPLPTNHWIHRFSRFTIPPLLVVERGLEVIQRIVRLRKSEVQLIKR